MSELREYYEDRLARQEAESERRIEVLEARLEAARDVLEWISASTECSGPFESHTCLWMKREGHYSGALCAKCRAEEFLTPAADRPLTKP